MNLQRQVEAFYADLGPDDGEALSALVKPGDVERWLAQGRLQLGVYDELSTVVEWDDGADSLALPDEYVSGARLTPLASSTVPQYEVWGANIVFADPDSVSAGSARLDYLGLFPGVNADTHVSARQEMASLACVNYAMSRFFRRLASSRVDYRRYSTITGQAGIDADDLRALADDHLSQFETIAEVLSLGVPSTFYGD